MHTEIVEWAEESGLVGKNWGDKVYETIESVHICHASSVIGCIAELWATAVHTISEKTFDESGHAVVLIVMPNCEKICSFNFMFKIHTMINFRANTCMYFGKIFELDHFHSLGIKVDTKFSILGNTFYSLCLDNIQVIINTRARSAQVNWMGRKKEQNNGMKNESLVRGK